MEAVAMAKGMLTAMQHKPRFLNHLFSRSSASSKNSVFLQGYITTAALPFTARQQHQRSSSISHSSSPWTRRNFVVYASSTAGGEKQPSIGFLGLGIMGTAMARNLVNAGYDVTVWNRSISKCDALVSEGAKRGETPEQTTAACDITFAMLADPAGAMEVACGPQGAVKGLSAGKGYVDISTVDDKTAKDIFEAVQKTGAEFLEAPVSGSKKPAVDGTLIFLTAGDKSLFDRASPMLDVMGKSKFYLGEVGNGAAMKLVVNMVMGSMMASFSEGLLLGAKAGLDPNTVIEVIGQGAISAPMFAMKGPSMVEGIIQRLFLLSTNKRYISMTFFCPQKIPLKDITWTFSNSESYPSAYSGEGLSFAMSGEPVLSVTVAGCSLQKAPVQMTEEREPDLRLAVELANKIGQPSPIAAAVNDLYRRAIKEGLGDEDFSAIIEALKVKVKS